MVASGNGIGLVEAWWSLACHLVHLAMMSCKSGFRAPTKLLTCCSFAQKLNCCWQAAGGGSWGVAGHGGACRCSGLVRACVGGLGGGQQGRQWRRQLRWQWRWRQRRQQCVAPASAAATAATAGGGARAGMAGGRGWGQHAALGGALFIRAASLGAPAVRNERPWPAPRAHYLRPSVQHPPEEALEL